MKVILAIILFLSPIACKNNVKSPIHHTSTSLFETKDSLDLDTVYAKGINVPDSVSLFFENADDTLGHYVRSYYENHSKEDLQVDSIKKVLHKIGFIVHSCGKSLCGFKRELNKRHNFTLRFGKDVQLITFFEYWFEGQRYTSPMLKHIY